MVNSVTNASHMHAKLISSPPDATVTETALPGKSGNAVGQRAKAVIAGMNAADPLPKNFQGVIASNMARGLPIESILALHQAPDPVVDDAGPVDDPGATEPVVDNPDTASDTSDPAMPVQETTTTDEVLPAQSEILDEASSALEILSEPDPNDTLT